MLSPAIYTGTLRHRRFEPVRHEFTYNLFMTLLDIDHIPELMRMSPFTSYNRLNWAAFCERDHFGDPQLPLRTRLETDAASNGIALPGGPIFLLTHLRYVGYVFNPVSFFYCFDRTGNLETILAEVNSTFGESRNYWLSSSNQCGGGNARVHCRAKTMHVSPFLPMDLDYRFAITPPEERLVAHIGVLKAGATCFDATLTMARQPWSAAVLHKALLRFPWMTAKVTAAIHWQALRLFAKRVPVFPAPARGRRSA